MKLQKVYIIILNYNGWKDTIECLESALKNDYGKYCDNVQKRNIINIIKIILP